MPSAGQTARRPFDAVLGLGSNVGDKRANIARALELLTDKDDIRVVKRSRDFRSAPWGIADQDWFINACAAISTRLSPHALLLRCQDVERAMGRVRVQKWGPRIIDVDILVYRDEKIDDAVLVVPHPLIAERGFVLIPLKEVAPKIRLNGRTLKDLIQEIDTADIVAMGDGRGPE